MLQVKKPSWRSGDLSEALLWQKAKEEFDPGSGSRLPLESKATSEILFGRWCWGLVLKLHLCNKSWVYSCVIDLIGGEVMGTCSIIKCIRSLSCGSRHRAPKTPGFPGDSSVFCYPK